MRTWTTDGSATNYASPTLTEIKNYLSIDGSAYDSLLPDIKYAVYAKLERLTGQNFNDASAVSVTVRYDHNSRIYDLPLLPVTSITSVTAYDVDDSSAAFTSGTNYKAYGLTGSRVGNYYLDIFTEENEVEVVYTSNGSTLPSEIKLAVLAWIKILWNDDRDFTGELKDIQLPKESMRLIQPYLKVHA